MPDTQITELPQEIIEVLIDELSHDLNWSPDYDRRAFSQALDNIRSCTQVSRSFRHRARRYLFRHLKVTLWLFEDTSRSAANLFSILEKDAELVRCVRTLELVVDRRRASETGEIEVVVQVDHFIENILRLLSHLTTISIGDRSRYRVVMHATFVSHLQDFFKCNPETLLFLRSSVLAVEDVLCLKHLKSLRVDLNQPWLMRGGGIHKRYFMSHPAKSWSVARELLPQLKSLDVTVPAPLFYFRQHTQYLYSSLCSNLETFRLRGTDQINDILIGDSQGTILDTLKNASRTLKTVELSYFILFLCDWAPDESGATCFTLKADVIPAILQDPLISLEHLSVHEPNFSANNALFLDTVKVLCALCSSSDFLKTVHIDIFYPLPRALEGRNPINWLKTIDSLKDESWAPLDQCLSQRPRLGSFTLALEIGYERYDREWNPEPRGSLLEDLHKYSKEESPLELLDHFTPSATFPQLYDQPSVMLEVVAKFT